MDGITPTTPDEANAMDEQLKRLEAEQAAEDAAAAQGNVDTNKPDERASEGEEGDQSASDTPPKTDTSSEAEAQKKEFEDAKAEAEKAGEEIVMDGDQPKRDEQGRFVKQKKQVKEPDIILSDDEKKRFVAYQKQIGGRYAADRLKQDIRWDNIKRQEAHLTQLAKDNETKLQGAIQKFNADVAAFRAEQQNATPTPEKYEAFATSCNQQATLKEAEAVKAEAAGDFDKAEALRKEAWLLQQKGTEAKQAAEHVRKNPPADAKAIQEKFTADQKSWIDKAAIDFPEFAKKDSDLQKATSTYYREMVAAHPAVAKLPGFIYFCVERANLKAAADRVPAMEKELGELRTRVKEQDALLNPVPGGAARRGSPSQKSFDEMTSEEQYAWLQANA